MDFIRANSEYTSFSNVLNQGWVTTAGTVELWINPDLDGVSGGAVYQNTVLISHGNIYLSILQDSNNKVVVHYFTSSHVGKTSTVALTKGVWNHVMYTWGSANSKLYIDGVEDWSDNSFTWENVNSGYTARTSGIAAHADYLAEPYYYDGKIMQVRIFSDKKDAPTVKTMYESKGSDKITNNIELWWRLNELPEGSSASGTSADLSGNGKIGTHVNTPTYKAQPLIVL